MGYKNGIMSTEGEGKVNKALTSSFNMQKGRKTNEKI